MSDETVQTVDPVLAAQMAIIDAAVRSARDHQWCGQFEQVMAVVFPDGPPDGGTMFVDSDGISCRGYDRDGYRNGYDQYGYDREGYTQRGFHRDTGRDRQGYDQNGYDGDGFHRDTGANRSGFTRDGIHAASGLHRDSDEYRARFRYDYQGYDRDGFNAQGYDRRGYTREGVEELGGVYAYDENQLDINGRRY